MYAISWQDSTTLSCLKLATSQWEDITSQVYAGVLPCILGGIRDEQTEVFTACWPYLLIYQLPLHLPPQQCCLSAGPWEEGEGGW